MGQSPSVQWLLSHPSREVEARLAIADESLKSFIAMEIIV
jgi:hypothetical protein